jgi:hypothetical protein
MTFGPFDFAKWNLIAWCVWAGAFFVLEFWGIYHARNSATLTYLTLHSVPKWVIAGVLGWLVYHFLIQYK